MPGYSLPYISRTLHIGERVYCYDRDGNRVDDHSLDEVSGLNWQTHWPKGYGPGSFSVHRDIARRWAIKNAYTIKIKDGPSRIVYQGRINDPQYSLSGGSEMIKVPLTGFYVVLGEKTLRKWWIDNAAIEEMVEPASQIAVDAQNKFTATRQDNFFLFNCGPGDTNRTANDSHYRRYTVPVGTNVIRVTFSYAMRSGEGIRLDVINVDNSSTVETYIYTNTGTVATGSVDHSFTAGDTENVDFRFYVTTTDIYDENDYIKIYDLTIYCELDNFASPNYYADEYIEDILYLKASELSSDYDQINSPSLAISPFMTLSRGFESLDAIIQRLSAWGDSSQNYYGARVTDDFGTSDGLPRFIFEQQPGTTNWEWETSLRELASFNIAPSDDELVNWVPVQYVNSYGRTIYLTPDDDADLKDTTSIGLYGERHPRQPLNAGNCDEASAKEYGQRYLATHADLLYKGQMSQRGTIRDRGGVKRPVNRVRAGHRVKVVDYNGGQVFMLRRTDYNADQLLLRMEPSLPADNLAIWQAQREAGFL